MKKLFALLLTLSLTGCQWLGFKQHHIEQGNVLTAAQVQQLHIGMSKAEITGLLGTPVYDNLTDPNRWVYVHTVQIGGHKPEIKHLTLVFRQDRVVGIER